jgi:hypothetical protein
LFNNTSSYQVIQINENLKRYVDLTSGEIFDVPADRERGWQSEKRKGLSIAHTERKSKVISPDDIPKVKIWSKGSLIKVRRQGPFDAIGGGPKTEIKGLSRKARINMFQHICMVERDTEFVLVTLTYPGKSFEEDPRVWKEQLNKFAKRLQYAYPKVSGFWRLELKRRKSGEMVGKVAPHYHLLIYGVDYFELLKYVPGAWWEVVGSKDNDHLVAGTRIERPRSPEGAKWYVAKYVSKEDNEQELYQEIQKIGHVGRMWGMINEKNIPWADCKEIHTSDKQVVQFMRYIRRKTHKKAIPSSPGSSLVTVDPEQWERIIEK